MIQLSVCFNLVILKSSLEGRDWHKQREFENAQADEHLLGFSAMSLGYFSDLLDVIEGYGLVEGKDFVIFDFVEYGLVGGNINDFAPEFLNFNEKNKSVFCSLKDDKNGCV